jgi:hypothetical protein
MATTIALRCAPGQAALVAGVASAPPFPYAYPKAREGASMPKRQRALRVEVQICAPKPSRYRWEIYDGDELDAIKLSQATYRSEEAARAAGNLALKRILEHE